MRDTNFSINSVHLDKIKSLVLMAFFCAVIVASVNAQTVVSNSLKGRVLNIAGNPISDIKITLESESFFYQTLSGKDGSYNFTVPTGVYRFSTDSLVKLLSYGDEMYIPFKCKSYFRPSQRAKLKLSREKTVLFDLILIESGSVCSESGDKSELQMGSYIQHIHHDLSYEQFPLNIEERNSLNLVIQYGYRREEKDGIYYFTAINADFLSLFGKEFSFTIITYDSLAIYADRLYIDKSRKKISALNAFMVESGKDRIRSKEITIDFTQTTPKFTLKN